MQSQQMNAFRQPQQSMFQPSYPDMSWEYKQPQEFSPVAHGKQRILDQQETQWDAEAFAAAFDAATQDALVDDTMAREIEAEREEIDYLVAKKEAEEMAKRQARQDMNHLTGLDLADSMQEVDWVGIESDDVVLNAQHAMQQEPVHDLPHEAVTEQQREQEQDNHNPQIDEELARTAGQLLESVSHDTSQKFQDSVFLQLMRRLRDKELKVDGEHFVEVGEDALQLPQISPHVP